MLKIQIKFTGMDPDDGVRLYAEKKIQKIDKFARHIQDETIVRVEIGRTTKHHLHGDVCRAEIQTYIGGADYRAVSETNDLYAAIDAAKEEILRAIRRNKRKEETAQKRSGRRIKDMLRRFRG